MNDENLEEEPENGPSNANKAIIFISSLLRRDGLMWGFVAGCLEEDENSLWRILKNIILF